MPRTPAGFSFRLAAEADLDRLAEIHLAAYPDERGSDARKRAMTANAFGDLADLVVVEDEAGEIVAEGRLFRMVSWFGGRKVKVGGIASVAVALEARGRGAASALVGELHRRAERRRDAITMLYPFRQGFYARLGYARTASRRRLSVDPCAVPPAFRALARTMVRRVRGDDRPAVERAYAREASRRSAWLARRPEHWEKLFARERRHLLGAFRGAKLVGYVALEIVQAEPHAETRLVVEEMVADDHEARRALWGALGAMRDQVHEIEVEVADDDVVEQVLVDPDARRHGTEAVEHALGEIVAGPMVRLVDVPRAVAARGYPEGPEVRVALEIDAEPESVGDETPLAGTLRIAAGRAELVRGGRGREVLRTTRRGLAAMLYGGLRLEHAVALGLADAPAATITRLAPRLACAPPFPIDPF